MRNHSFLMLVLLLVVGVFGVTDGVKSVSVMEGDSVTLLTNLTKIQTGEDLKWKFPDDTTIIAEIDRETNKTTVPGNEKSFECRLKLNETTGSLTITNIKTTDSGVYQLKISHSNDTKNKEFIVSVDGVFSDDGVKKRSERKGESVILQTRITSIPEDDVIEWTFGPQDTDLVKTDRQNNILIYNEDVTFKDRLQLDTRSGDLTVKNINTEVSGFYKVKIIKRTHTLLKIFSVTVDDSQERSGSTIAVSVICGAGVVLLAVGLTVCWKKRKQSRPRYPNDVQSTEIILN